VLITVLPLAARARKVSITEAAVYESRPVVGSSKKNNYGSVISSTPIAVRLRSPPEIPLTKEPPILVF
jgi:hypothetical protein